MSLYLDNIIFALQKAGGISLYWYELIKRHIRDANDILIIDQNSNTNIFFNKLDKQKLSNFMFKEYILLLQLNRYLKPNVNFKKNSIFHSSYYRLADRKKIKNVVTVHDFTYELFCKGLKKSVHTWQKSKAILNAETIICISNNTKKDLLSFYPEINENRIKVIYIGVSDNFFPLINSDINYKDKIYILFVGSRVYYKNFNLVVNALAKMKNYNLFFIGGGPISRQESELLQQKIPNRYKHFDSISSDELNILYNNAFALLYPSQYEGFGIPVLEAMKAGCPVIASNDSSIPEVGGNAIMYLDQIDINSIVANIKILESNSVREKMIKLGYNNVKRFSWEKCYQQTMEVYKNLI